nr:MAG TPA: hypothetical protein [Caudoviricetes sp.]
MIHTALALRLTIHNYTYFLFITFRIFYHILSN